MPLTIFFLLFSMVINARTPYWKSLWVQNGCSAHHYSLGESKEFPGTYCIFLPDGTFVSATDNSLRRFGKTKEVLWEIKGHYHHQINLSVDGTKILALTSEIVGTNIRADVFQVIGLDGKILRSKSAAEILRAIGVPLIPGKSFYPWPTFPTVNLELSHFNSFYEVPENARSSKVPWLRKGNFIVNSLNLGVFILSPELDRVLFKRKIPFSFDHLIHDVQVSPDGALIYFNNLAIQRDKNLRHSEIQKYDTEKNDLTFSWYSSPMEVFYSPICGGVQELDEDILFFSHVTTGGYVYSRKEKKLLGSVPSNSNWVRLAPTQELRLIDLTKFLENAL